MYLSLTLRAQNKNLMFHTETLCFLRDGKPILSVIYIRRNVCLILLWFSFCCEIHTISKNSLIHVTSIRHIATNLRTYHLHIWDCLRSIKEGLANAGTAWTEFDILCKCYKVRLLFIRGTEIVYSICSRSINCGLIHGRDKRFMPSSKRSEQLCGSLSLLWNGYQRLFPRG